MMHAPFVKAQAAHMAAALLLVVAVVAARGGRNHKSNLICRLELIHCGGERCSFLFFFFFFDNSAGTLAAVSGLAFFRVFHVFGIRCCCRRRSRRWRWLLLLLREHLGSSPILDCHVGAAVPSVIEQRRSRRVGFFGRRPGVDLLLGGGVKVMERVRHRMNAK